MVWTAIKLPCASLRLPTFWASSTEKLPQPTVRGDLCDIKNQVARWHTDDPRCGIELVHRGPSWGDCGGALLYCWLRVSGLAIPFQNQGEAVADKQTGSDPARTRCRARRAHRHFGDCEGGVCVQPGCRPGQWRLGKA